MANNNRILTWSTTLQVSLVASLLSMAFLLGIWKSEQEADDIRQDLKLLEIAKIRDACWTKAKMHTWVELLKAQNPDLKIPNPDSIK